MPRYLRPVSTLAAALLAAGSLLTFPASVPAMVAIWLAASTAAMVRRRPGFAAISLLACVVILAVKRVAWLPGTLGLIAVLSAVAMLLAAGPPSRNSRRLNLASGLLIWIAWAAMARDWHLASHTSWVADVSNDGPIVCLGNSLTSGLPPVGGYPRTLKDMVSAPVVDFGQAGITTDEGLDTAIRQLVLFSPHCPPGIWLPRSTHMSDDGLHPNAQGNQLLARVVADCLADLLGKRLSDVAPLPRR